MVRVASHRASTPTQAAQWACTLHLATVAVSVRRSTLVPRSVRTTSFHSAVWEGLQAAGYALLGSVAAALAQEGSVAEEAATCSWALTTRSSASVLGRQAPFTSLVAALAHLRRAGVVTASCRPVVLLLALALTLSDLVCVFSSRLHSCRKSVLKLRCGGTQNGPPTSTGIGLGGPQGRVTEEQRRQMGIPDWDGEPRPNVSASYISHSRRAAAIAHALVSQERNADYDSMFG